MKKITMAALLWLLLLQGRTQVVSVNYVRNFVSDSKSFLTDKNFVPYTVEQFTLAYSQHLGKLPLAFNATAGYRHRNPPPRIIRYPDPYKISSYAIENKIEADSASFSNSSANAFDVLAGVGYMLPHKADSKFIVTVNADFGVGFNDNTALNFYLQGTKTGVAEQKKIQFIISPSVQAKYFFTNNIGINLIAGYNNTGGVNAGAGIVIGNRSSYVGHVTLMK